MTNEPQSQKERGVSPVIGVVLVISITILLAAVLAIGLMEFSEMVEPEVNAGVTLDQNSSGHVTVTYTSEGTADHVLIRGDCSFTPNRLDDIGSSATEGCSTGDKITVVAVHDSGTESTVDTHTVE